VLHLFYAAGKPATLIKAREQAPFGAIRSLLKRFPERSFQDENLPHPRRPPLTAKNTGTSKAKQTRKNEADFTS
jgi:hypothetical protein